MLWGHQYGERVGERGQKPMPPHVDGRPTNYTPLSLRDKTFLLLTRPCHLHVECLLRVTHVARPACRFSVIAHVIDFSWACDAQVPTLPMSPVARMARRILQAALPNACFGNSQAVFVDA